MKYETVYVRIDDAFIAAADDPASVIHPVCWIADIYEGPGSDVGWAVPTNAARGRTASDLGDLSATGVTPMIDLATLEQVFEGIREKTDWDIDGPMLWGYFFSDPSHGKLESLASVLKERGFAVVDIFVPDSDYGDNESYCLHVERVESHTVQSLHQRNQEFYALADRLGVDLYDGMDVGPPP